MESQKTQAVGSVMVVGGGVAGTRRLWTWQIQVTRSTWWKRPRPSAARCPNWTRPSRPTIAPCASFPPIVECGSHPNITLLTLSELTALEGEAGNFTATVTQHPRYIDRSKCTGCGECATVCPVVPGQRIRLRPVHQEGGLQVLSPGGAGHVRHRQAGPGPVRHRTAGQHYRPGVCPAHQDGKIPGGGAAHHGGPAHARRFGPGLSPSLRDPPAVAQELTTPSPSAT